MGFEKFGLVSFTSQTRAGAFIDYLEKGELRATRCKDCGRYFFPPRADCSWCMSKNVEWVKVEGQGTLDSYTKVYYGPTGFEGDVPYILALVDFKDVKVFGRLSKTVDEADIKVGMALKFAPLKITEDKLSYEFFPA